MNEIILAVIVGAAIAGFVQGLSGFAFGMVSMAIWAWFIEPLQAAVLVVFGSLCGQIMTIFKTKRGLNIKLLWPFLFGGLLGVPIGLAILPQLNIHWFKIFFGSFLIVFSMIMLFSKSLPRIKTRNKLMNGIVGLAGGIMSASRRTFRRYSFFMVLTELL